MTFRSSEDKKSEVIERLVQKLAKFHPIDLDTHSFRAIATKKKNWFAVDSNSFLTNFPPKKRIFSGDRGR